jgi:hypothetical protein
MPWCGSCSGLCHRDWSCQKYIGLRRNAETHFTSWSRIISLTSPHIAFWVTELYPDLETLRYAGGSSVTLLDMNSKSPKIPVSSSKTSGTVSLSNSVETYTVAFTIGFPVSASMTIPSIRGGNRVSGPFCAAGNAGASFAPAWQTFWIVLLGSSNNPRVTKNDKFLQFDSALPVLMDSMIRFDWDRIRSTSCEFRLFE